MKIEAQSVKYLEDWFCNGFDQIIDKGYDVENVVWIEKPMGVGSRKREIRAIVYVASNNSSKPNNLILLLPPLIIKDFESNNN